MKYSFLNIKEIIENMDEETVSKILFRQKIEFKKRKYIFLNIINEKIRHKGNLENKHYEFLSEILTNFIALKFNKGINILYKPLNSRGFDGAFLLQTNKYRDYRLFVSECKSSDVKYDSSQNNELNKKQKESYVDLKEKIQNISTKKLSNDIDQDIENMYYKIKDKFSNSNILFTRSKIINISSENKKRIWAEYEALSEGKFEDNWIIATMSKYENKNIFFPKWWRETFIEIALILNDSKKVLEIFNLFLEKIRGFYE